MPSPTNILLTSQLVAKMGDLGVAKALRAGDKQIEKKTKMTKLPGTVDFMPPETFTNNPVYDSSLDVFSFGGISLFVLTEQWPTPSVTTKFDPKLDKSRVSPNPNDAGCTSAKWTRNGGA